jgi:hypothetical protein
MVLLAFFCGCGTAAAVATVWLPRRFLVVTRWLTGTSTDSIHGRLRMSEF